MLAALFNHRIHNAFGQRGVALLAPGCHLVAYIVNSLHPPYPVLVVSFIFAGFGNGLTDSAWNAWIGNMARADEILGFLHGFYGIGAVLSPLAATSLITKANCPWYYFYYIMVRQFGLSDMPSANRSRLHVPRSRSYSARLPFGNPQALCFVKPPHEHRTEIKRAACDKHCSLIRRHV